MRATTQQSRKPWWWNVNAEVTQEPVSKGGVKETGKPPAKKVEEPKLPMAQRVQREVIAWFWVGLAFLLINGTIGQARVIPSGSMENTLLVGDHLIMSRVGYDAGVPFTNWHVPLWRNPKRQQIVIFKPPFAPDQPDYVKRVIGLPGDTVDIHDGSVWINGQRLDENYTLGRSEPYDLKVPYKVPDKCYFVMGDNRGNSYDSRFWGCVPRNDIIGTPVMIYMSLDVGQNAWEPGQIRERFLAYANAIVHPGTVRWRRLFRIF
jgi:signal peptidase I